MHKVSVEKDDFRVQLVEFLIFPRVPCSGKLLRARSCPTKIRILYHLYQLNKNVEKGVWSHVFQGEKSICSRGHFSKRKLSNFINSEDFKLFGEVQHRNGTTNIYRLHKWVIDLFHFFEVKGMMKNFRTNFEKWKKVFKKRLDKWLLPLLRAGNTLYQILMNKISTKKELKVHDPKTLKVHTIKYSSSSYKTFQGSRSNTELSAISKEFQEIEKLLRDRVNLKEGDIHKVSKSFSLNHLKRAYMLSDSWLKKGMDFLSPIRVFQTCLNRTRY